MKIENIAHLAFKVKDLDKALHFYCDCLGMKKKFMLKYEAVLKATEDYMKETQAYLEKFEKIKDKLCLIYLEVAPMQFIELFPDYDNLEIEKGKDSIGYTHLCLEVKDIKATREELLAKGIKLVSDINLGLDNTYQFWITDPDGNQIEIMQYTDKSLQLG